MTTEQYQQAQKAHEESVCAAGGSISGREGLL